MVDLKTVKVRQPEYELLQQVGREDDVTDLDVHSAAIRDFAEKKPAARRRALVKVAELYPTRRQRRQRETV
jgi:hypothetical protein